MNGAEIVLYRCVWLMSFVGLYQTNTVPTVSQGQIRAALDAAIGHVVP